MDTLNTNSANPFARLFGSFKNLIDRLFNLKGYDRIKVIFLALSYFSVIGGYTVLRELRDTIFVTIVGRTYILGAQVIAMLLLVPVVMFIAYVVDRLKKHELLYLYASCYAIGTLIIAYYVGHPTIGVLNTNASSSRIFGWLVYLFIEGYLPFITTIFLSFLNTLVSPQKIPQSYPVVIGFSKLGGMAGSSLAWWIFRLSGVSEIIRLQSVVCLAALILLGIPLFTFFLVNKVPEDSLYGYEASYTADKEIEKTESQKGRRWYSGLLSGLTMLLRTPYALGIFGLVFFWEATSAMICFQRLGVGVATTRGVCELGEFLMANIFWAHFYGFFLAFFLARFLLNLLGQKYCLILVPIATATLLVAYFTASSPALMMVYYPLIRAINISFSFSVREGLYIPTTKYIRYKAKSWLDTFGQKTARGLSSGITYFTHTFGGGSFKVYLVIGLIINIAKVATAAYLGRRFEKAIKNNEVIG